MGIAHQNVKSVSNAHPTEFILLKIGHFDDRG